jgi:hypothetical protein
VLGLTRFADIHHQGLAASALAAAIEVAAMDPQRRKQI